ncbi:MAG: undecaprenyl-phosphate glucose phosphotransferase [Hyphomicrobiaceae bacterium]
MTATSAPPPVSLGDATTGSANGDRATATLSRTVAVDLVAFADVAAIVVGAMIPAAIFGTASSSIGWTIPMQSAVVAGFIGYLCLRDAGLYDQSRLHDLPSNPSRLAIAVIIAVVCVVGLGVPAKQIEGQVIAWYATWAVSSFTAMLAFRQIARRVLARLASAGRFDRRFAVFGSGTIARRVQEELDDGPVGIRFAGAFDDRLETSRLDAGGIAATGTLADLIDRAEREEIDDILIALPASAHGRIAGIVRTLERAPCNVHIVTHIASDLMADAADLTVSRIGSVGVIDAKRKPLADWSPIVKRVEDIVIACAALVVAVPILAVAAIAIKLESEGPVIYRQRRRGLNRRTFDVLKLRTLSVTEADGEVRQVEQGDTRVTRVGALLRRTSIDELPQLVNVLRGEMSIVGPRPHALVHDDQFSELLEDYANRHQVKPGITGLAQVNGLRGQTETVDKIKARVDCDMAYVKSWSLWLDLEIIWRTVAIVVMGRNAY